MRVLWLDGYGVKLGVRAGALYIRDKSGESQVPLSDVDLVIVASGGVNISSRAIRLMLGAGIELAVLDSRGMPVGLLHHSYYTRTPLTRRAQYEAYSRRLGRSIVWEIVRAKLWNQACTLHRFYRGEREIREAVSRIDAILGMVAEEAGASQSLKEARRRAMMLEAWGAREYWAALSRLLPGELGFRGRDHDSGDPVNIALNYGYGILYSLGFRALALAGLDPYAGFLHVDRSGRPVLVYDYVEIFRSQMVDLPLVKLFLSGWRPRIAEGLLDYESRRKIASRILEHARRSRLESAIRASALALARSLREGSEWRAWRGCEL